MPEIACNSFTLWGNGWRGWPRISPLSCEHVPPEGQPDARELFRSDEEDYTGK